MTTVAQQFAHTLKEIGVRFVFGVPSGNMIDYMEAITKEEGIEFVLVSHETAAAFMAGVCGRLTGIPGVCFGTFGPGATNLTTGVGGAFLDHNPMLVFTDEMPENLRNRTVQMNIDNQALFQPITKWTNRVNENNIREVILKAAGIAMEEVPGPVHLGIPSGIGSLEVKELNDRIHYLRVEKELSEKTDDLFFENLHKMIFLAKRPIIAVGLSAVRAGINKLVVAIVDKFQIPIVLTPMAKGIIPEDHPLYVGVLFHALSDEVAETYSEADLVIGIGYDPVEFNYEDWMPDVPLIHFDTKKADVDITQIKKVVNVIDDLNISLPKILNFEMGNFFWDLNLLHYRKEKLRNKFLPIPDSFGPLDIIDELQKLMPDDGILTVDVGAHLHLIGQMWQTPSPEKLLMTNGWSSMGFAIPAALAAKLCNPETPVVAILGDGGFLMSIGELATAKRLKLKIVFIVIVDGSLSLIRIKQQKKDVDNSYGTNLNNLWNVATNHYFGVPVFRVQNRETYMRILSDAFLSEVPVVIEVVVDGSEYDNLVLKPNRQ